MKLLDKPHKTPIDIVNRILEIMNICGTCCCFITDNFLKYLLEVVKLPSERSRTLLYQLLEKRIYPELGCYSILPREKIVCLICRNRFLEDNHKSSSSHNFIASSVVNNELIQINFQSNLSCINTAHPLIKDHTFSELWHLRKPTLNLDSFRDLLLSDDFRVIQSVTSHLLKCASKMTKCHRHTILFEVFFPMFLLSKTQFSCEKDDISVFRILSSLSIFSSLLNNFAFAQQFIDQKGLDHVLDLISVPIFTSNCCLVLEKAITITVLTPEVEIDKIPSLIILKKAVDASSTIFLEYFDESKEILDSHNSNVSLNFKREIPVKKKEEIKECKKIDILESVSTFWRTYANLTLCSPILRKYFSQKSFSTDCLKLLKAALFSLADNSNLGKKQI